MALLGPTRLFIFGKSCHLYRFLLNKYQKIPTYTPLSRTAHLLISEKTSHVPKYTIIRAPRLLGTLECYQDLWGIHISKSEQVF